MTSAVGTLLLLTSGETLRIQCTCEEQTVARRTLLGVMSAEEELGTRTPSDEYQYSVHVAGILERVGTNNN